MKTTRLIILTSLLLAGPLITYLCLKAKDTHFDEVVNKSECLSEVCEADFDGDGIPGRIQKRASDETTASSRLLIVTDSGRELLRTPYNYIDGTLRTHVAIREESGKARLLIFDGVGRAGEPIRAVFEWDGQKMAQVQSTNNDLEILSAMAARDDAGTWNDWALFRAFSLLSLLCYYLLLTGIVIGLILRTKLWPAVTKLS